MRTVPDWAIQLTWWASGIFATGAGWYFLSTKEYGYASTSAACALLLAVIAVALHRKKDALANAAVPQELLDDLPDDYVRRSVDSDIQTRIIQILPDLKEVAYRASQVGWGSPVTIDMIEASYDAVAFLEFAWLRVAEFYPHKHFGRHGAHDYVKRFVRERYKFHRARHEPGGPGTGGTIVGPLTGADVVVDLERLIEETVQSLFMYQDEFDLAGWQQRWRPSV